jgi:hypothetical protein
MLSTRERNKQTNKQTNKPLSPAGDRIASPLLSSPQPLHFAESAVSFARVSKGTGTGAGTGTGTGAGTGTGTVHPRTGHEGPDGE